MAKIEAILFDMDGVIIESCLDLAAIKRAVFGRPDIFIIEGINQLPEDERAKAWEVVEKMEVEAAYSARIIPEAEDLFRWMDNNSLKRGIVTRNSRVSVDVIQQRVGCDLGVIIAREDAPPKPSPDGVLLALSKLGVNPGAAIMVGDFAFDIDAGNTAGCRTIFLRTPKFANLEVRADYEVQSLDEVPPIINGLNNE